jgi:hypothetical protein
MMITGNQIGKEGCESLGVILSEAGKHLRKLKLGGKYDMTSVKLVFSLICDPNFTSYDNH